METPLAAYLLLFTAIGVGFVLVNLLVGQIVRPDKPEEEKATVYECGEPTIGSAWVQFDLRYYVVALLFVIFDVEVAFFFPWAIVFGKYNTLAETAISDEQRAAVTAQLVPALPPTDNAPAVEVISQGVAQSMAWIAFADLLVFFGVLLVGFAYLWKRGDINWVRSVTERGVAAPPRAAPRESGELVGAGRG